MIFVILTMLTALSISGVAIYYSVAGLVAIFAGAAIPIIIMGGILEVSKLVTAVWLHRFWHEAPRWLRYYLLSAVIVLMFITSMGIFGFLSKAHIEQSGVSQENTAKIERVVTAMERNDALIEERQKAILSLQTSGTSGQASIQLQIDKEQERIDSAYDRIRPLILEQNRIIENYIGFYREQLQNVDNDLAVLQGYIDSGDIEKAQAYIGTKVDGKYGPKTAEAFTAYQQKKEEERAAHLTKFEQAAGSIEVEQARAEITRLRASAERQILKSEQLIAEFQTQLQATAEEQDVTAIIAGHRDIIQNAEIENQALQQTRFELEADARKLAIEVGPVKYIAELIYTGSTNNHILEEAVRWVIIVLVFVFDPLAVILLIASQYSLKVINPNYMSLFDLSSKREEIVELKPEPKKKKPQLPKEEEEPKPKKSSLGIDVEAAREWVNQNLHRHRTL